MQYLVTASYGVSDMTENRDTYQIRLPVTLSEERLLRRLRQLSEGMHIISIEKTDIGGCYVTLVILSGKGCPTERIGGK